MRSIAEFFAANQCYKDRNVPYIFYPVHKGKYSWESTLIAKNGELERIMERAAAQLESYAGMMGFGEEYCKVIAILADLNAYHMEAAKCASTGCDWLAPEKIKPVLEKQSQYQGLIFGHSQNKIAEMQDSAELK